MRGEGHARSLPDRALVRAVVEADGESHESAYAAAARPAAAVDEVVAQHKDVIASATTASIVVQPKTRWRKGESVRTGWRAARTTVIEVTIFDGLGELIAELSASGAASQGRSGSWILTTRAIGRLGASRLRMLAAGPRITPRPLG